MAGNGLLDFIRTPEGQGLLSAVAGGMAGARSGTPWNNVGRGLLSGVAGYGNAIDQQRQEQQLGLLAKDRAQMQEMRGLQMTQMQADLDRQKGEQSWWAGLPNVQQQALPQTYNMVDTLGDGTGVGTASTTGNPQALQDYLRLPNSPYANRILEQELFPKASDYKVVGNALVQVGPNGVNEAYRAPDKPEPLPTAVREYQYGQSDPAFNAWLLSNKKAGANNVNVTTRVENKASDSVAGQVGPILDKSLTATEGAIRVLDASDRVVKALDSGKVITGPLANARVTGLQIGQMLGVGGKDSAEILANTRQAIRGLSEMTLQGRKEMSGQGAITDRESALAEKATSGDINDLTAGEIRELAAASARASRYQIQKHRSRVQSAGNLPGMQNITPFFDVPPMEPPPAPSAAPVNPPMRGQVVDGYRFKGGNPGDPKNWEQAR